MLWRVSVKLEVEKRVLVIWHLKSPFGSFGFLVDELIGYTPPFIYFVYSSRFALSIVITGNRKEKLQNGPTFYKCILNSTLSSADPQKIPKQIV